MKKLLSIPLIVLLSGCPGKGKEGAQYGKRRTIDIDGNRICFTLDKNDVLENYSLALNSNAANKILSSYSTPVYYPDTCFTVNLEKALVYGVRYTLNQKLYYYTFIIDNDGQAVDLGGEAVCSFPRGISL